MYGKELQALANDNKNFLKKDREIIRKFFRSHSQLDKGMTRQYQINFSASKDCSPRSTSRARLIDDSMLTDTQRKSNPDLFAEKHPWVKERNVASSELHIDFNQTMSQLRNKQDTRQKGSNVAKIKANTSSKVVRSKSVAMQRQPHQINDTTPSKLFRLNRKISESNPMQNLDNSETLSLSQQRFQMGTRKSIVEEPVSRADKDETAFDSKQQANPSEVRVGPESISIYLDNRKKYGSKSNRPIRWALNRQEDLLGGKLDLQRVKRWV